MQRTFLLALAGLLLLQCSSAVLHSLRIPTRSVTEVLERVDQVLERELDLLSPQQGVSAHGARFTRDPNARRGGMTPADADVAREAATVAEAALEEYKTSWGTTHFQRMKRLMEAAAKKLKDAGKTLGVVKSKVGAAVGSALTAVKDVVDAHPKLKAGAELLLGVVGAALGIAACFTPIAPGVMLGAAIVGLAFNMVMTSIDVANAKCTTETAWIVGRAFVVNGLLVAFGMGVLNSGADALMSTVMKSSVATAVAGVVGAVDVAEDVGERIADNYGFMCPCGAQSGEACQIRKKSTADDSTGTEVTQDQEDPGSFF